MLRTFSYCLLALFVFLTACEIEEAPYKSLGGFGKVTTELTRTDTVTAEIKQNVLVEDFTGWACGNCPQASEVVAKLEENYGHQIISTKIHVTEIFAQPDGKYQKEDLRTPVGNEIFEFAKGQSLPNGLVNRRLVNGRYVVSFTEWEKLAQEEMAKSPAAVMKIHHLETEGENGRKKINSQIQMNYIRSGSLQDKLALYLVEDSVIGTQKDYRLVDDPYKKNYPHSEVFRGAVTGAWGEEVRIFASDDRNKAPNAGQKIAIRYEYELNSNWKSKNMSLIAVLYDDKTKQVIQVAKQPFSIPKK